MYKQLQLHLKALTELLSNKYEYINIIDTSYYNKVIIIGKIDIDGLQCDMSQVTMNKIKVYCKANDLSIIGKTIREVN